ncbi:TRAP transporter large permease subunit [Castellaniella sp.]|uniref:TRAP transporter large permease n=1 Tax=Castellaniella sp. TaxID=1955812 RepID=UPI00355F7203
MAIGSILGSGTLGILIPPSIMLIVFGEIMQIPIGQIFAAALFPGLLLGVLYMVYIAVRATLNPTAAPANPVPDQRPLGQRLREVLINLIGPAVLIMSVLISIIVGVATPTEGAAIGAFGAMVIAWLSGNLRWPALWEALRETSLMTGMILILAVCATAFSLIFKRIGGQAMIEQAIGLLGSNPYMVILAIMILLFILGFFLEWIEISFLVLPMFAPVVAGLDFGTTFADRDQLMVWFAILVAVNLQTSFLTPPFGYALFYLKGANIEGVSMGDIYRSVIPIVLLQLLGLVLIVAFPSISLWLASLV